VKKKKEKGEKGRVETVPWSYHYVKAAFGPFWRRKKSVGPFSASPGKEKEKKGRAPCAFRRRPDQPLKKKGEEAFLKKSLQPVSVRHTGRERGKRGEGRRPSLLSWGERGKKGNAPGQRQPRTSPRKCQETAPPRWEKKEGKRRNQTPCPTENAGPPGPKRKKGEGKGEGPALTLDLRAREDGRADKGGGREGRGKKGKREREWRFLPVVKGMAVPEGGGKEKGEKGRCRSVR